MNTHSETKPQIERYIKKIEKLIKKNNAKMVNYYNEEAAQINSMNSEINKIINSMYNNNDDFTYRNNTYNEIYENSKNNKESFKTGMNHLINRYLKIKQCSTIQEDSNKKESSRNKENQNTKNNQYNNTKNNNNTNSSSNNNNNNNNHREDSNSDSEPQEIINCSEDTEEEEDKKKKNKQSKTENIGAIVNTKQTMATQRNANKMITENNIFERVPEIVKTRYLNWTQNTQAFSGLMIKICRSRKPFSHAYNLESGDSKKETPLNNLFNYVWEQTMSSLSIDMEGIQEDAELDELFNAFDLYALEFINKTAKENEDYYSEKEKYPNIAICQQLFKELEEKKNTAKREEQN